MQGSLIRDEVEVHRRYSRPLRSKPFISVAIPSSTTSDAKTLREQTLKIGYIGRAAAVFRVEEVFVYSDGEGDLELIYSVLRYLEVPPYLKKALVPLSPKLMYVGVVPPLKAPHHVPPEVFGTKYRDGVVVERYEDRCVVDIGLEKKGIVRDKSCPPQGSRVAVRIVGESASHYIVKLVDRDTIDIYWGYRVEVFNSLKQLLQHLRDRGYTIIVATKKGMPIYEIEENLAANLRQRERVALVFGGAYLDVDEIVAEEGLSLDSYADYAVNFIPRQGSVNVRTEEAVIACLAIMNYIKEKALKSAGSSG